MRLQNMVTTSSRAATRCWCSRLISNVTRLASPILRISSTLATPASPAKWATFPGGHPVEPIFGRAYRIQLLQMRQTRLEFAQGGRLRWCLDPVELAAPRRRIHCQHPLQSQPLCPVRPWRDHREEVAVHLSPDPCGQRVQRRIARQLESLPDQLCCGFFNFTFAPSRTDAVQMNIEVPDAHIAVLDGLAAHASAARQTLETGK
jgi:hypothetical protein